jgi:hypothetical protein
VLEDPLIDPMPEVRQTWDKADVIARQTFPGVALPDLINLTVNTRALSVETEKRLTMQKAFEVEIGSLTDQFQLESKGLADGFRARELKHFEVSLGAFKGQRETRLIGRREHPMCLCRVKGGRFCMRGKDCKPGDRKIRLLLLSLSVLPSEIGKSNYRQIPQNHHRTLWELACQRWGQQTHIDGD